MFISIAGLVPRILWFSPGDVVRSCCHCDETDVVVRDPKRKGKPKTETPLKSISLLPSQSMDLFSTLSCILNENTDAYAPGS